MALLPISLMAQIRVSGVVIDPTNNEPVIGAGVVIKGTTNGTITDLDGRYEIVVPSEESVL